MKKMWQYIQDIKSFFRIAPHLKDNTFYEKAFWYYLVFLSKGNANSKIVEHVIRFWVVFSYVVYRIYETVFFFKVFIVFVIIVELSSRFIQGNQYLFDKLSLVYGPELKTKFGNPFDGSGFEVLKFAGKSVIPMLAGEHFAHFAADIAYPDTDNGSSLLSKSMEALTQSMDQSRQISDLEKQNAVKDAVIASQHEMHNRTLEFVFEKYGADTSSKIAADSPIADLEADQLESFRQFQAWQESQSNSEVIPEQSYAEKISRLRQEIDELRQNPADFFKKP